MIGRVLPALKGMSGLVSTAFTQLNAAATVEAKGEFMLVAICGLVPAKSMAISSAKHECGTLVR